MVSVKLVSYVFKYIIMCIDPVKAFTCDPCIDDIHWGFLRVNNKWKAPSYFLLQETTEISSA